MNQPVTASPPTLEQDAPGRKRRAWRLLGAIALVRLAWLWLVPLDLAGDEAYYWDWGRRPAWGYFSKPPMIAWLNTLTGWLGATTAPAVRVPAVLLGTLGLAMLWLLARRLWGERAGVYALVLGALAPGGLALNFLLTIDAPLLAAWAVALYALWRALEPAAPGRTRWWLLYVVAAAFGVLSKQMMLVFPLLAAGFVFTSPPDRAGRSRVAAYLWLAAPWLALIPVLAWNAQHGWPTLHHMAHHFEAPAWTAGLALRFAGEFIAGQAGLAGPVVLVMLLAAAWNWRVARADRRQWFAWMFSVPPLAVVLALSLRQRVQPNWPAAFYPGGMLLVTGWLATDWPNRARWWRVSWKSGVVLAGLAYGGIILIGPLGQTGGKLDLAARLRGWAEFGQAVGTRLAQEEKAVGEVAVVVAGPRQWASELAFYLPGQPEVWRWTPPDEPIDSQYALWPGPLASHLHGRALLVLPAGDPLPAELARSFTATRLVGKNVTVHLGANREIAADCWLGEDMLGWTEAR